VVAGWSDWVVTAQIIARDLQALGFEAKVQSYDFSAYFDHLQTGDFDLSIGWSSAGPTPYEFYRPILASSFIRPVGEAANANWHRLADPESDRLLEAFERTSDPAEQKRVMHALERRFVELAPALPLVPSPTWAQYNDRYFVGFPTESDPYSVLAPYIDPQQLLVFTRVEPRSEPATPFAQR
jgi:peptide/nickel transport system substrate-binding protein